MRKRVVVATRSMRLAATSSTSFSHSSRDKISSRSSWFSARNTRHDARAVQFVAIHERMVAANVKQVSCRDLDRLTDKQLSHRGRLWRRNGRLEQRQVTNPGRTAMGTQYLCVYGPDCGNCEIRKRFAHAKRLKSFVFLPINRRAVLKAASSEIVRLSGNSTMAPPS